MDTVGAEVYPEPGFNSETWIIFPCETLAIAVALIPPPPVSVICGVVYPEPLFITVKLIPVGLGVVVGVGVGVVVGVVVIVA